MNPHTDTQLYRDVGALQADVKTLEKRTAEMDAKLDALLLAASAERATKRTLIAGGGIVGSIFGFLASVTASWWLGK